MRVVAGDFEIVEVILEDGGGFAFEDQLGKWAGFALELLADAFDLVQINVAVAAGPDEVAGGEVALLRNHAGEERVLRDIENFCHIGSECYQIVFGPILAHIESSRKAPKLKRVFAGRKARLKLSETLLTRSIYLNMAAD